LSYVRYVCRSVRTPRCSLHLLRTLLRHFVARCVNILTSVTQRLFCSDIVPGSPWSLHLLRPLAHAPETVDIMYSTPDYGASFSCRCTTTDVVDCLRVPKAVNDVRSRASTRKKNWRRDLASNLSLWCRFLEPVSGACILGLRLLFRVESLRLYCVLAKGRAYAYAKVKYVRMYIGQLFRPRLHVRKKFCKICTLFSG